ncbi:hypothetical protein [Phormidesmis sp. 146-33]
MPCFSQILVETYRSLYLTRIKIPDILSNQGHLFITGRLSGRPKNLVCRRPKLFAPTEGS